MDRTGWAEMDVSRELVEDPDLVRFAFRRVLRENLRGQIVETFGDDGSHLPIIFRWMPDRPRRVWRVYAWFGPDAEAIARKQRRARGRHPDLWSTDVCGKFPACPVCGWAR